MLIARPHPWLLVIVATLLAGSVWAISADTRMPPTQAPHPPSPPPANPSITVYSSIDCLQANPSLPSNSEHSYAIVSENRRLNLTSGESQLELAGIPLGINPASLFIRPATSREITLIEHTYIAPATTPDDILRSQVGHDVIINRRQQETGDAALRPETITGRLLAFDHNSLLVETNNRQLPVEVIPRTADITEIKFIGPTSRSILQPVVACRFLSDASGPADVQLSYQTSGIRWQCTYNLVIRDKDLSADLEPWVRISNSSGVSYPQANLRLGIPPLPGDDIPADLTNPQYTISRPVALPDNSTQQIALFPPRRNLRPTRVYVYCPPADTTGSSQPQPPSRSQLDLCLLLNNDAKEGLGIPLPPGRIQIYRESNPDESPLLLGQRPIPATPIGRSLLIKLATAENVLGQRQASTSKETRPDGTIQITEKIEITIHNPNSQPIRAILLDPLPRNGASVLDPSQRPDWQDARRVQFSLDIAPNAQGKVTYKTQTPTSISQ
ncbi:MAG: DUF4139 domain-containing protein [Bacillota bacterium]